MGAQGTTTVDFGAFPGNSDTSVVVTGQPSIVSGSLVEAWLYPVATADHAADEHLVDGPVVMAGNIVAGTGFTIYARARDAVPYEDPPTYGGFLTGPGDHTTGIPTNNAPTVYGQWTVAWAWN